MKCVRPANSLKSVTDEVVGYLAVLALLSDAGIMLSVEPAISSNDACGFLKSIFAVTYLRGTRRDSGTM